MRGLQNQIAELIPYFNERIDENHPSDAEIPHSVLSASLTLSRAGSIMSCSDLLASHQN
jgi:hypothetical protein